MNCRRFLRVSGLGAQVRGAGPTEAGEALAAIGIMPMQNGAVRLQKDGRLFWLAGLGDQIAFAPTTDHRASRVAGYRRPARHAGAVHRRRPRDPDGISLRLCRGTCIAPALTDLGKGCAFAPRCRERIARCDDAKPPLEAEEDAHLTACWVARGVLA